VSDSSMPSTIRTSCNTGLGYIFIPSVKSTAPPSLCLPGLSSWRQSQLPKVTFCILLIATLSDETTMHFTQNIGHAGWELRFKVAPVPGFVAWIPEDRVIFRKKSEPASVFLSYEA
jgi:hypothetical protein